MARPFDIKSLLARFGDGAKLRKHGPREVIFKQGDAAEAVFYIQSGSVKITAISEQGKEAVVGILTPGQFFGEGCLTGQRLRVATAITLENCSVTSIGKNEMLGLLAENPKFNQTFVSYLVNRNTRIEEDLLDQLFNSSEKRLARLLLLLSNFGNGDDGGEHVITPNVSQETLAEMIGTTRSRISHFMNKFRKHGLIDYNGKIKVNRSLLDAVLREKRAISETTEDRDDEEG